MTVGQRDHVAGHLALPHQVPDEALENDKPGKLESPTLSGLDRVFLVPDTGGAERGAGFDARVRRGSRRYVDVAAMLAGGLPEPPAPSLLARSDGHCLFYEGQVNVLFGDPESGKTLIALAALTEVSLERRRSVFVDIDHNGPEAIVGRLLAFGVDPTYLADPALFRYMEPEDRNDLLDIVAFLRTWQPAAAVVDSLGELLPLLGRKSNDPDDFTTAHSDVLKPIAVAGAAVIGIDHLAKNTDSRAAGPTGTAAKRRTVSGASIRSPSRSSLYPAAAARRC